MGDETVGPGEDAGFYNGVVAQGKPAFLQSRQERGLSARPQAFCFPAIIPRWYEKENPGNLSKSCRKYAGKGIEIFWEVCYTENNFAHMRITVIFMKKGAVRHRRAAHIVREGGTT